MIDKDITYTEESFNGKIIRSFRLLHKTGYFFKVSTNNNSITYKELQKEFIKQLKK